jgi:hypothetical protein
VDASDETSAWLTARPRALKAIRKVLGPSDYKAHAGVYSGGANGVYWVEKIAERPDGLAVIRNITDGLKRSVEQVTAEIEPDLLYPLLRGRDVRRWSAAPSAYVIMVQDPKTRRGIEEDHLQAEHPKAYQYLKRFESVLRQRKSQSVRRLMEAGPFYSMFAVGDYTFAPHKVVWAGIASDIMASAISSFDSKVVLPEHVHVFVGVKSRKEALYAAAVMNSTPFRAAAIGYSQVGGKSFATPHIVEHLHVPTYEPSNDVHNELVALSREAHDACKREDLQGLAEVEADLDRAARRLWGMTQAELSELQAYLVDLRNKGVPEEERREAEAEE